MLRGRIGALGRNTAYTSAALGLRAVMQAAYLILLSRSMGPGDYGLFAGSVAAAVLLAPLSGWGMQFLLAERVGKQPEAARAMWASALLQVLASGAALSVLAMLGALAMHDRLGLGAMAMLVIAELLLVPVTQSASMLLLSLGRGAAGAMVVCLVPAFRLVAVGALSLSGSDMAPTTVASMHVLGSAIGVAIVVAIVGVLVGGARWRERPPLRESLDNGTRYAFGMLVGTSYTEVDKVLLLQLAGAMTAGLYTAAFRLVAVFAIPVSALTSNALPRPFAAAASPDWRRLFNAVVRASAAYAAIAAALALFGAQFVSMIFGDAYAPASAYVRWLAPWIVLYCAHQVIAMALTSLGQQKARVWIEAGGMALIVALNVALVPRMGAEGAVLALLAAESAIAAACLWRLLRTLAAQSRPQTT